ncbi:MAG: hypothetical protein H6633_27045 [Anaerolineales bacterium]|nr:hypothetical protein [Anaerolineales bacterium]
MTIPLSWGRGNVIGHIIPFGGRGRCRRPYNQPGRGNGDRSEWWGWNGSVNPMASPLVGGRGVRWQRRIVAVGRGNVIGHIIPFGGLGTLPSPLPGGWGQTVTNGRIVAVQEAITIVIGACRAAQEVITIVIGACCAAQEVITIVIEACCAAQEVINIVIGACCVAQEVINIVIGAYVVWRKR